jgi:DNA polymerase I-like protein with 3'-5' exonuclease and polymerase domains
MIKFVSKYKVDGIKHYATLEDVLNYLRDKKVIGIDIETSKKYTTGQYPEIVYRGGLDPYLSNIVMLQLGDLDTQFVIDVRDFSLEELKGITDFLNYNPGIILVGANLKFEAKHLKHKYNINLHTIYDVMLAELCLYNGINGGVSLADLAERYLNVPKKKEYSLFQFANKKKITLDERLLNDDAEGFYITPFELADDFAIDKSTRLQFINIQDKPFTLQQITYGADDIIFPILIRERQLVGRVLEDNTLHRPTNWIKIENHYCLVLADMELNGMKVEKDKWQALHDKNYIKYQEREEKLVNWIVKNYPEYSVGNNDLFTNLPVCTIKWSSSKQVVTLFKKLGICPKAYSKQTKKVEYTVGAVELLRTLPNNYKLAYEKDTDLEINSLDSLKLAYLLYKKSEQAITTFGKMWLKYVHPITGRCHSSYRQILNTGRISSTSPNLNNISGGAWRDCFSVEENKVMINSDYANQEVRRAAEVADDIFLMNFFIQGDDFFGDDFHSYTATKVYSLMEGNPDLVIPPKEIIDENGNQVKNPIFTSEHGSKRTNAKSITFSLLYGGSVYSIASDLGLEMDEAEKLVNSYLDAFPGLKQHFKKCEENASTISYIDIEKTNSVRWFCPFFKEIKDITNEAWSHFPEDYSDLNKKDKESARKILYEEKPFVKTLFQQAGRLKNSLTNKNKNYPIQGSCAMMLKIAMSILRKRYIEEGKDIKIIGNIYDEVLLEVSEENAVYAGDLLKYCMERGGSIISPKVPQKANYIISKKWEH